VTIRLLPVYVIHFAPLLERRAFMERQLAAADLSCCFIEEADCNGLSSETIKAYYEYSEAKWREQIGSMHDILAENACFNEWKSAWSLRVNYTQGDAPPRRLLASEIACTIKHLMAYEKLLTSHSDAAIVLEDDAILDKGFSRKLQRILRKAPQKWDFIFLGSGAGLRVPGRHWWRTLYQMQPPRSKCADAYLIHRLAARRILSRAIPFTLTIDFLLGYWMKELNMLCYWHEPPIVRQGSETGLFESAIM